MRRETMSIRAKLVMATAASMAAIAVITGALVREAGERNVLIAAEQAVSAAGQALASSERADVEKLQATLDAIAVNPAFVDAFVARDRKRLLAIATPLFAELRAQHDVTHFYFIEPDPSRTCFLRVHAPDLFGDVVDRATLSKAIETRTTAAGKELGKTAFALRVVRPWVGKDGKVIGYLELGEEIDHFLGRMKLQTGDDYALLVEKGFLDETAWAAMRRGKRNNWGDLPRTVVVNGTNADESIIAFHSDLASVPDGRLLLEEENRDDRTFARGIVPVNDATGRRVGGLFVLHDITAFRDSMLSARRGIYILLVLVAAALGGLLLLLANRLVFRRLDRMIGNMEDLAARLAGGDYDVVAPRASNDDEIGRFEEFLGRFLQVVAGLLKELTRGGRNAG